MAREREIKIELVIPLEIFLQRIQSKGFKLLHVLKQTDIYFDTLDWFLYKNLAALRLRKIDNVDDSFSFKKLFYLPENRDHYYIEEIEVKLPCADVKELGSIFRKLQVSCGHKLPELGLSQM